MNRFLSFLVSAQSRSFFLVLLQIAVRTIQSLIWQAILLLSITFPFQTALLLILLLLAVLSLIPLALLRWGNVMRVHGFFPLSLRIAHRHVPLGHHIATVSLIDGLRLIPKYFLGLRDDGKQFLLVGRRGVGGLQIFMRFGSFLKAHAYEQIMCKIDGIGVLEVVADDALIWRFDSAKGATAVGWLDLRLGKSFHSNRIVY